MEKNIEIFLKKQEKCINEILSLKKETIEEIIKKILEARNNKNRIFTMGNGGSGSTASHFVSDLLKTAITEGDNRFSAISLVDNIPVLLAWSNDSQYEDVFVEQLKNHLHKNDIVLGFSGSGTSQNILSALEYAKNNGAFCIGMTGMSGGEMSNICNICLTIPSDDMLTIESAHLILCHCIVSVIRDLGNPMFRYE
jgi:D-sedoheptulose 7-phosphate isomerase